MSGLAIADLRPSKVRSVIRRSLKAGLDTSILADFVASIDWSGAIESRRGANELATKLAHWLYQYEDDDISRAQFIARLLTLLPEKERWRGFFPESGGMSLTVSPLRDQWVHLSVARFEVEPQTGPYVPIQSEQETPESDIVPAV